MNSLVSLHVAYVHQKNIYDEVKNFQKQDYHSLNFSGMVARVIRNATMFAY